MDIQNDILSVLGQDDEYTVINTPSPSGVPSGFALGNSFRQRGIFDSISLVLSSYGYSPGLPKGLPMVNRQIRKY